jgi:hypothetical protein
MKDTNMDVCEKFEGRKWRVCRVLVCLALGGEHFLSWLALPYHVLSCFVLSSRILFASCCVVLCCVDVALDPLSPST